MKELNKVEIESVVGGELEWSDLTDGLQAIGEALHDALCQH